VGVGDEYLAFCLDQAIGFLGTGITQQLNELAGDTGDRKAKARELKVQRKIEARLALLLGLPEQVTEKRYRTPGT
jgi:hypothetical protein